MNKVMQTQKKIEKGVVAGYKKIENGVVTGYQKIEDGVVSGYKKMEDKFVEAFLTPDEDATADRQENNKQSLQNEGSN